MKNLFVQILALTCLLQACKTTNEGDNNSNNENKEIVSENSLLYDPDFKPEADNLNGKKDELDRYNPTATRTNDLIHTKLEVSFDFKKRYLYGKATLELCPYFYATNTLSLDAKGFDIAKVQLVEGNSLSDLKYTYDTLDINITLPKTYKRGEKYTIYIEYTAKPDELEAGGSAAITSDKGLYFIDPEETDPNKPTQIWTQGETEASSCWFPTIDRPNEKMTQEIAITVPNKFVTLSNGLMVSNKLNSDGTRTDVWRMNQPHTPYLCMMAIGEFKIVTDKLKKKDGKEIDVSYYMEPEFEQYGRDIFGETPKMIQFFSDKLGVEYAWDKYAQVIVRDYVSGAMENTTATIHGEFLNKTKREMIDGNNESIIAHELFHHWFGDLVTCESWSNLPLNESFANYSQYLWDEFKYGLDEADFQAMKEGQGYFMQAKQQGHFDMIRFDYIDKEEMFDGHSYNKGGRILHMLRGVVGDDAFFESLKTYLNENKFQTGEIHQLRLAFEKVTGRDLNWFFNQWFLASGHPEIKITQEYDETKKLLVVKTQQLQDMNVFPLYELPVKIDVYTGDLNNMSNVVRKTNEVVINKREQEFSFECNTPPLLVNFDADKTLLCEKNDDKSIEQFIAQYYIGKKFLDRYEAVKECSQSNNELAKQVITDALNDKFWSIREFAIKNLKKQINYTSNNSIKEKLILIAKNDEKSLVRAAAIKHLAKYFEDDKSLSEIFKNATNDQSFEVMAEGFAAIAHLNPQEGLSIARINKDEKNSTIQSVCAEIISEFGSVEDHDYFIKTVNRVNGFEKYTFMSLYSNYLKRLPDNEVEKGISVFEEVAKSGNVWWIKLGGYQYLNALEALYSKRELEHKNIAESLSKEGKTMEAAQEEQAAVKCKNTQERITSLIIELKGKETDKNILQYLK